MLRGIHTAASGMLANQRRSEALTNNIANANATGYKADAAIFRSFPEYLLEAVNTQPSQLPEGIPNPMGTRKIGALSNGVYTHELIPSFEQGDLAETGSKLDLAIYDANLPTAEIEGRQVKPSIFFAVRTGDETLYTRNGEFTLNANRELVTADGSLVLNDQRQPIVLPTDKFEVTSNGTLVDSSGTEHRLGLFQFEKPTDLVKAGNSAFRAVGTEPEQPNGVYSIHQGFKERSNVDMQQTMVEMMSTLRAFEASQKVLTTYNQTLDSLIQSARV